MQFMHFTHLPRNNFIGVFTHLKLVCFYHLNFDYFRIIGLKKNNHEIFCNMPVWVLSVNLDVQNISQNTRKVSNLGGYRAQWPVSLEEIKVWQYQSKTGISKVGIKHLSHCRILLDFSVLFRIFCPWLVFLKISNYKIFAIYIYIVLSHSGTHEATRIPSLLYRMSRFVLLTANWICTKTL